MGQTMHDAEHCVEYSQTGNGKNPFFEEQTDNCLKQQTNVDFATFVISLVAERLEDMAEGDII
jgi:hypothetical protein